MMFNPNFHRPKRRLSKHQKQMRFLTGFFMLLGFVIVAGIFWWLSRPSFATH
jgi:NhaP-type Na+/H+ or K+/H+ antiporter